MPLEPILLWSLIAATGIVVGSFAVYGVWKTLGAWRIRQAGPRPLASVHHLLWRDPGDVASLDLVAGPGGAGGPPSPPFRFRRRAPRRLAAVPVGDRRTRPALARQVGERGQLRNLRRPHRLGVRLLRRDHLLRPVRHHRRRQRALQRAGACIDDQCRFTSARFELDDPSATKLFEEHSWAWNDNPFLGSRELHGLKILTMLLSNWDTKDRRDVARGSNTAIFEHDGPDGREARYLITDWGGSMGSWGSNIITRGRWNAEAFDAQTPQFVTGAEDGVVNSVTSGSAPRTSPPASPRRTCAGCTNTSRESPTASSRPPSTPAVRPNRSASSSGPRCANGSPSWAGSHRGRIRPRRTATVKATDHTVQHRSSLTAENAEARRD